MHEWRALSLSAGGDGVDAGAADPERLGHLGGAHGGAGLSMFVAVERDEIDAARAALAATEA